MPLSKLKSNHELSILRDELASRGERLVFTNGCFDVFHAGHARYLEQARALGGVLAVGLNGDASVRSLKGEGRPVNPERDRAEVLCALECVGYVTIFPEVRATRILREVRPHIYVKGGDYTADTLDAEEREELARAGCEIRILPLVPGRSTTVTLLRQAGGAAAAPRPLRLGVLGSGKGSNFQAIQAEIARGALNAETRVVISDCKTAPILALAESYGITARFIPPGRFRTKLEPEAEQELLKILREQEVDLVVLAGFMRLVKAPLLNAFPRRIINIHPSLLPKFPGLEAWRQALISGEKITGCTVHYVDAGIDSGEIIAQREVPILEADTPETLHARIQGAEHILYPEVIDSLRSHILAIS